MPCRNVGYFSAQICEAEKFVENWKILEYNDKKCLCGGKSIMGNKANNGGNDKGQQIRKGGYIEHRSSNGNSLPSKTPSSRTTSSGSSTGGQPPKR